VKGLEGMEGRALAELSRSGPVLDEVKRAVSRVNKNLAPYEQIRKYRVLDRDFSIDQGELTPTMKVRRMRVLENWKPLIQEMYAGKEDLL
jgi:long-chain acyl-CoA synthetase